MKRAALVLSGGGSLGAAHIGAVRALQKEYVFDFFAGVSAGAIVSASLACGKSPDEISQMLGKQNFFRLAFDFTTNKFGMLRGEKVLNILEHFFEGRDFSDLPDEMSLVIGTTDFSTGERVMITSGSIARAVRASLSVPVLFQPFFYQDRWLVDGGLSQNFPLDTAIEQYWGDHVVGIDVATSMKREMDFSQTKMVGKMFSMRRVLERTFRVLFLNQQHFADDERVRIIRPELANYTTIDILKLREIERQGEESIKK